MNSEGSYLAAWFGRPAYAVATYLVAHAILSVISSSWPADPGSVVWRYSTEGTLSSFLTPIILGLLLASAAAVSLRHSRVLLAVTVVDLLVAAICFGLTIDFGLNGIQIRRQVNADNVSALKFAVVRGCLLFVTASVLSGWLAIVSRGAARQLAEIGAQEDTAHPLVSI
ncbi:MAG: hypothetical protein ACREL5_09280 [Gemmatimonadales bacterium]